ncbi:MAG TPA: hypothetical protein DF715_02895 [Oceanicaulis sp.]|nr:hypothetical protein [Synechococcus moorigangaii CMS01]HCY54505.1 hypothetical protein [Oceanicaulis sp.]
MDEDILIPIAFFLAGVMIVLIAVGAAVINRFNLHETVREALRQGKTLDADAIKALGAPKKQGQDNDLKSGLILVAVAVGLVVMGAMFGHTIPAENDDPSLTFIFAGIAAIPGFIGLVLAGFGLFQKRHPGRSAD